MKNRNIVLSSAFLVAFSFAGLAAAQQSSGNIMGEAKPGDTVLIQNVDTGFSREVKVKDNGRYALRGVPTGTFHVTVKHADGTTDETKAVTIHAGTSARVQ
jgi:hypothetical protein